MPTVTMWAHKQALVLPAPLILLRLMMRQLWLRAGHLIIPKTLQQWQLIPTLLLLILMIPT